MASEIEFRIKTAPKDKRLNLRIPGELFDYINKTAHLSMKSVAEYITDLVLEDWKKQIEYNERIKNSKFWIKKSTP